MNQLPTRGPWSCGRQFRGVVRGRVGPTPGAEDGSYSGLATGNLGSETNGCPA